MVEKDSRNLKEIEEFILVKNDETPIFRETDVKVRPVAIGKKGPVFEIIDKDNNRIGIVKDDKTFQFDPKYKTQLKELMGSYYDLLKFEEEVLKYDVVKELQKQDEKEISNQNKEDKKEEDREKEDKKDLEKKEEKETGVPVTKEELEEKGYDINAFTMITDEYVLKDMDLPNSADKNCVLIAEVEGTYKCLYRENGTGDFIEQEPENYKENSIEEVDRLENNKQYEESIGTRMMCNRDKDLELSIKKENGQLKIGRITKDETGKEIVENIKTNIGYPTEQEYNRIEDERADRDISSESTLSPSEVDEIIDNSFTLNNEINEQTKENIRERAFEEGESITKGRLEEIIEEEKTNTADRETAMRQRKI